MTEQKATNVTWHEHKVSKDERAKLSGHKGAVLWFTGLSACGKSTIANAVDHKLHLAGKHSVVLDGDNIRMGLNKNLGFSPGDRAENIRRIGEVAKLFTHNANFTLTAFISPYRADRDAVRALLQPGEFIEILVDASIEKCGQRDPKGLYKKALAYADRIKSIESVPEAMREPDPEGLYKKALPGEIANFTGISDPYEAPEKPELVLDSNNKGIEELTNEVIAYLEENGYLKA